MNGSSESWSIEIRLVKTANWRSRPSEKVWETFDRILICAVLLLSKLILQPVLQQSVPVFLRCARLLHLCRPYRCFLSLSFSLFPVRCERQGFFSANAPNALITYVITPARKSDASRVWPADLRSHRRVASSRIYGPANFGGPVLSCIEANFCN